MNLERAGAAPGPLPLKGAVLPKKACALQEEGHVNGSRQGRGRPWTPAPQASPFWPKLRVGKRYPFCGMEYTERFLWSVRNKAESV